MDHIFLFPSSFRLDSVLVVRDAGEGIFYLPPACSEAAIRVPEATGPAQRWDQEDLWHHHDRGHPAYQGEGMTCGSSGKKPWSKGELPPIKWLQYNLALWSFLTFRPLIVSIPPKWLHWIVIHQVVRIETALLLKPYMGSPWSGLLVRVHCKYTVDI